MTYKVRIWETVQSTRLREYSFTDIEGIDKLTDEELKLEVLAETWDDSGIIESDDDTDVIEIGEIEERGYGI